MVMWPNMMGGFFGGWGYAWMIFIFIFVTAVIVGIILLIVWLVKKTSGSYQVSTTKSESSLEILKERYAKGEITKKEFEIIKRDIS